MLKHHPSIEQLVEYCSGSMPLSHSLCVATHIEYCDECRKQVETLTQMGGLLIEDMYPSQANAAVFGGGGEREHQDLKSQVFDLLDDTPEPRVFPYSKARSDVPVSLQKFITGGYSDLNWSNITLSIKVANLLRDKDGTQIALSRTKPGGKMFHHSHTGDEITVVLKGSFSDEDGLYKAGDFVFRDAKDKHTPVVTNDDECICLMVMSSPIQFTGFFTRLLNPLVRMNH